ncbi:hypothetical protein CCR75_003228 [Bremia lactucae]|uniref:Uncharacterized protein n=1 Tax=Bremia lactucae TaxID=4779 RepID=A0A976FKQ4_BRELC|nr:hypothetical protein CCR75_003228 [Bremia lactucae]
MNQTAVSGSLPLAAAHNSAFADRSGNQGSKHRIAFSHFHAHRFDNTHSGLVLVLDKHEYKHHCSDAVAT